MTQVLAIDPQRSGPPIIEQRVNAAQDSDGATVQTVAKMAEYIRSSASDPVVRQAASYAWKRFAGGRKDPSALAFGVFWYVKHCVRFRQDEATLFRLGEHDQQDLLIAPAVLVRMKEPAEDCDGFTMLCCALLLALGVQPLIVTVAADRQDPMRWSHVFAIALTEQGPLPIDSSHGRAQGWMVPRRDIHRWQAWGMDGRPVDLKLSPFAGLHGYMRAGSSFSGRRSAVRHLRLLPKGRGMGGFATLSDGTTYDTSTVVNPGDTLPSGDTYGGPGPATLGQIFTPASTGSSYGGPTVYTTPPISPAAGPGINWTSVLSSLVNTAGSVAKVATLPQGATLLPSGAVYSGFNPSALLNPFSTVGGSTSWLLPILGIGLLFVVLSSSKR